GSISIDQPQAALEIANDRCVFVNQGSGLLRIEEQIANFGESSQILGLERIRLKKTSLIKWLSSVAVHVIGPREIDIPRDDLPALRLQVVIEKVVLPLA